MIYIAPCFDLVILKCIVRTCQYGAVASMYNVALILSLLFSAMTQRQSSVKQIFSNRTVMRIQLLKGEVEMTSTVLLNKIKFYNAFIIVTGFFSELAASKFLNCQHKSQTPIYDKNL